MPAWALAERQLLALNADGVKLWAGTYLDANGYLRGAANFGIEDGPDDAVESIRNWPLAHALGGAESIIEAWDKAWEGHLDQYTKASDPSTELREGRHVLQGISDLVRLGTHRRGLGPFYWYGLSRPKDERYRTRAAPVRRLLPERGSGRAELRREAQAHSEPVQRQPWRQAHRQHAGRLEWPAAARD